MASGVTWSSAQGYAKHWQSQFNFVVVANGALAFRLCSRIVTVVASRPAVSVDKIKELTAKKKWDHVRFVSSLNTPFNRDFGVGEAALSTAVRSLPH
jgi:predicted dithiol-disulfide oxidoreductase (DUF899 family)